MEPRCEAHIPAGPGLYRDCEVRASAVHIDYANKSVVPVCVICQRRLAKKESQGRAEWEIERRAGTRYTLAVEEFYAVRLEVLTEALGIENIPHVTKATVPKKVMPPDRSSWTHAPPAAESKLEAATPDDGDFVAEWLRTPPGWERFVDATLQILEALPRRGRLTFRGTGVQAEVRHEDFDSAFPLQLAVKRAVWTGDASLVRAAIREDIEQDDPGDTLDWGSDYLWWNCRHGQAAALLAMVMQTNGSAPHGVRATIEGSDYDDPDFTFMVMAEADDLAPSRGPRPMGRLVTSARDAEEISAEWMR